MQVLSLWEEQPYQYKASSRTFKDSYICFVYFRSTEGNLFVLSFKFRAPHNLEHKLKEEETDNYLNSFFETASRKTPDKEGTEWQSFHSNFTAALRRDGRAPGMQNL